MSEDDTSDVIEDSTTAENILAVKELLSSKEAKDFVSSTVGQLATLTGQTSKAKVINVVSTLSVMTVSFVCIGLLGYFNLVTPGTTSTLAGMIIGYFFKKAT